MKRWARQRLATGRAFNTIGAGTQALTRFSGFLDRCQPPVRHPSDINRGLLERYLGWPPPLPLADDLKVLSRVFPRSFLDDTSATCLPRQAHSESIPVHSLDVLRAAVSRRGTQELTQNGLTCRTVHAGRLRRRRLAH